MAQSQSSENPVSPQDTKENTNFPVTDTDDPLALLYNDGPWIVYAVTVLRKMKCSETKLKHYESLIQQAITGAMPVSLKVYKVSIIKLPNLKYCEHDNSAIEITVTVTTKNTSTLSYSAILLSWGQSLDVVKGVHLPYLLEKGEEKMSTMIKASLQTLFNCNINQFKFTQLELLQFAFNFVNGDTTPEGTDPITLIYESPNESEEKQQLKMTFEVDDIRSIQKRVLSESKTQTDTMELAYNMLQNQVFNMVKLNSVLFMLSGVNVPNAEMHNNGQVNVKTPAMVNTVLTLLNEITKSDSMDFVH